MSLILRTLGTAGLYAPDRDQPVLGPGKPLALLIYLALIPGHRTSREFLTELLWADLDPERGRAALRQVLFHLRRLLGDQSLIGAEELILAAPPATDRDRFLTLVETGDLEAAVESYGGHFLPAFGVPGGATFEQWADLERDRLRSTFLRCAELLARRHLNQSRFREAQRLARRARDAAPEAEAAWRLLLETIMAGRDFVAAAVEAEALEQLAAQEELHLEAVTRAAIARARQMAPSDPAESGQGSLVAELTGREREFAAIVAAWDSARAGTVRHVHLTAPAGLGKTRLLREATSRFRAAGVPVAEARGTPGDRDLPYAFAGDLALAIAALPGAGGVAPAAAATLVALNPALSSRLNAQADPSTGEEALRRRIQALADLVHAVAEQQPFVILVDDVHWVDPPSWRVLEGLWGRLSRGGLLFLTAGRPERRPAAEGVIVLPLNPLAPSQLEALVGALGALPEEDWARGLALRLHTATGGSPLLVLESLRLALDEGILVLDGMEWRCQVPARLEALLGAGQALRRRVTALQGPQAQVLILLATAGTPLPVTGLAAASGVPPEHLGDVLSALERQGMVAGVGDSWAAAHDEIATASRDALGAAERVAADRAIGLLLVESGKGDAHAVLRGLRHLRDAGETALVERHFRPYAALLRRQGDRRPFRDLAAEVLGEPAPSTPVARLVRSLPATWRAGLWSRARQVSLATAMVALALGSMAALEWRDARARAGPRLMYADSAGRVRSVLADRSAWDGRHEPVVLRPGASDLVEPALTYPELPPALSPDGLAVAWNRDAGDSTVLDVWLRTPAGTRRLTHEPRDDLVNAWLPDGSGLVGMSNRWSSPDVGGYDIAVFDTATGAARQLSDGPDHDREPQVSPDGTRVAFVREQADGPIQLCLTAFDGLGRPECRLIGGHPVVRLVGWTGLAELLVVMDSGTARPLVRYDWIRDHHAPVVGPSMDHPRLSPDRRWVVGALRLDGIRGVRDWVVPLDRPSAARQVALGDRDPVRWWEGRPDHSLLVDRIEIPDSMTTILPGIGTRLGLRALTAQGTEVPLHGPVRWASSDPAVATVDSTGEIHPRSTGVVTISASLAGWRRTARRFTVGGAPARVMIEERWDNGWRDRWITFGDPHPEVTAGPGGVPAFWNRGDGSFWSLGISRQAFRGHHGLGVEVQVSTPLTRPNWQKLRIALVAGIDTAAYRDADQREAQPAPGHQRATCELVYPTETGEYGRGRVSLFGGVGGIVPLGPASRTMATGDWWTARLQVLPDGRCAAAINGQVLWISPEPIPLDGEFRVRLGAESRDTRILHGPLRAWTGVLTDLDWGHVR